MVVGVVLLLWIVLIFMCISIWLLMELVNVVMLKLC